jgi:hypothetical protein
MTDLQEYIKQHRLLLLQAEEACATLDWFVIVSNHDENHTNTYDYL